MQLDGYTLGSALGRGATATVFQATHTATGERVAIKLYSSTRSLKPAARKRVQLELQTLSRLEHPGVVRLRRAGEAEGQLYMVMDLVEGETLQARLDRSGPLGEREARALAQTLSAAVDYVHRCGVLHRDLKPDNVLLSAEGPRITDFGLARDLDEAGERLTLTGALLGTPGYLAPEQASGIRERVGKPADAYGLGGVLYACLTGVPPIRGESMPEVISATVQGQVTPPSELRPGLDPHLERLCLRCLALNPSERPSAEELARELAALDSSVTPSRTPLTWVAVGLLLVAALAAGAWFFLSPTEPPPERIAAYLAAAESGDVSKRRQAARALIEDFPDSALGYAYLSVCEGHQAGNWEEALRLIEFALERDPENAESWRFAATARRNVGDRTAALAALDRAVALDPRGTLASRAGHHQQDGDPAAAERDLRTWLDLDPTNPQAWSQLARLFRASERWPETVEALTQALAFAPESELSMLHQDRSAVREQAGDLEGALADLDLAAHHRGEWHLGLRAAQAHLLIALERYAEAAVAYRQALEIYPHQTAWVYTLHRIETRLGNHEEAARLLERAYELSKKRNTHPDVKRQIEESWAQRQR